MRNATISAWVGEGDAWFLDVAGDEVREEVVNMAAFKWFACSLETRFAPSLMWRKLLF
jgi:hypothetical protein